MDQGSYAAARDVLERALAEATELIPAAPELAALHNTLGVLAKHTGRFDAALAHYKEVARSAAGRSHARAQPRRPRVLARR